MIPMRMKYSIAYTTLFYNPSNSPHNDVLNEELHQINTCNGLHVIRFTYKLLFQMSYPYQKYVSIYLGY